MRHFFRRAVLLPAAVLLAAATACSSTDSLGTSSAEEPEIGEIQTLTTTAGLAFPLDAYELDYRDKAKLEAAQSALVKQCMARYGLDYQPPAPLPPSGRKPNARVFGLVDAAEAARSGYATPGGPPPPRPAEQRLSSIAQRVLAGGNEWNDPASLPMSQTEAEKAPPGKLKVNDKPVPTGGCGREAYLKLHAPKAGSIDILYVFNLKAEAEARMRTDSRVIAVNKNWAACMKDAGYRTTDPRTVVDQLGLNQSTLSGPNAVSAAMKDVACKQKVKLPGVWFAVASAYQEQSIDKNAETLERFRTQTQEKLKLAAHLIN
ncbi:hypothetical protein ACFWWS_04935 [Streptomyces sp. NPDC059083]|uniref:hypothetical protein n=1 Tax=unclassified Streptomyces TaxID=2593676 RepID=UPI0036A49B01